MSWLEHVNAAALAWLLEEDRANPAIRAFALRDRLDRPSDDPELRAAWAAIMASGPVPAILVAQHPEGYWQKPGGGYGKYRGTAWQIILLGSLGADPTNARVRRGCTYLLNHSVASTGGFSYNQRPAPGGVVHCLNGNLLAALIRLGWLDDPWVQQALGWQVRAITGEVPIQYYSSGTSGPDFACGDNRQQPCAWGATKVLNALLVVPPHQRTPLMERALAQGAQFLLRYDLAEADYPATERVSAAWFKLGFPLSYWSDVLETLAVLVALGYGHDPRLATAYRWLVAQQDVQGRWRLENTLNGKLWSDIERKGQPSKWVTLRALRVIKAVDESVVRA
ncbi:MAG: nitrogen fixation protein NifH [Chloroflexales bacterium]|nr:nitrogen fixation protein NifH [Chloroflexales bacterium]